MEKLPVSQLKWSFSHLHSMSRDGHGMSKDCMSKDGQNTSPMHVTPKADVITGHAVFTLL